MLANSKTWAGKTDWSSPNKKNKFKVAKGVHTAAPGQAWKVWGWRHRWLSEDVCCKDACNAWEGTHGGERFITFGIDDFGAPGDIDTKSGWGNEGGALPDDPKADWAKPPYRTPRGDTEPWAVRPKGLP